MYEMQCLPHVSNKPERDCACVSGHNPTCSCHVSMRLESKTSVATVIISTNLI